MNNQYIESKYNEKEFIKMIEISDIFVKNIVKYLLQEGYIVRMSDDKNPFYFPNGELIRGLDIFCAKDAKPIFIDAKDWPKLIYHDATGIPIKLYKRYKNIQDSFGIKAMIFFIDNLEFENNKIKPQKSKFKKGNEFIPYGGFMDDFILYWKQDIPHKSESKIGEIYYEPQIIWIYSKMKSIEEIFSQLSTTEVPF